MTRSRSNLVDPCGFGIVIVAFPFLEALERVALFLGWLDGKKHCKFEGFVVAWDDDSNRGMPCVETGLCVYASDALEASPFSAIAAPYLRKRVDQLPCVVPLT